MTDFYKQRELTPEERELDTALDQHRDALKDEKQVLAVAALLWLVGIGMTAFSAEDSRAEHVGSALVLCALITFVVHLLLVFRTRKYRYAAKELLDAYRKKNAWPFYTELLEMFANKEGVHLHLNDNGSITVTDKRKQEEAKDNG